MPRDDHAGARIAEGRKLGGYTQRGFADMIGFSCSQLHQVEGGLFGKPEAAWSRFQPEPSLRPSGRPHPVGCLRITPLTSKMASRSRACQQGPGMTPTCGQALNRPRAVEGQ